MTGGRIDQTDGEFFEHAPVLLATASLDGYLTRVGGPWEDLLGWTSEELTTRPFIEFVHPDDIGGTIAEMVGLNEGRPTVAFRNRYRTTRGSWVWLQWFASTDEEGTINAVAHDVSEVVERERELDQRRRIFEVVATYQQRSFAAGLATVGLEEALTDAATIIGASGAAALAFDVAPDGQRFVEMLASHGEAGFCEPAERRALIEGTEGTPGASPTILEAASVVARFGRPMITSYSDGHVSRSAGELLVIPIGREHASGVAVFTRATGSFLISDIEVLTPLLGAFATVIERDRTRALTSEISAEVNRLSSMLGTMLEHSDFTVIVTDAEGRVEDMNATASRTLGGRAAVDEHWPLDRLLAPGVAHGSLVASLVEYEGGGSEAEWTFVDRSGRSLELIVSASPVFTTVGSLRGWMLIGRPTEERDRAERDRLERARLNAQVDLLQRRERQLAALTEATQYVVASHTHREALDVIDHFLPEAFGTGNARLMRVHAAERIGQHPDPTVLHPNDCWAIRTGRTFHSAVGARVRCPHLDPEVDAVCAPLGDGMHWTGVIVLRSDGTDDAADAAASSALLDDVARQLSNAIANLRLRRALEEQAYRDPLTGVGNRRAAEESLGAAITRARSHREPFAVVMVDLDDFKRVNDEHGHEVGDRVLLRFAEFLRHHTREDDAVARVGGEEFLLVLRDIPFDAVPPLLEGLRAGASQLSVHPAVRITASFGVAHTRDAECTADELVAAADAQLYAAKRGGRNRVEVTGLAHGDTVRSAR